MMVMMMMMFVCVCLFASRFSDLRQNV